MNKKYKFILMLLIVLFAISSYFFIKEIAENKKENNIYEDLQEIVKNEEKNSQTGFGSSRIGSAVCSV